MMMLYLFAFYSSQSQHISDYTSIEPTLKDSEFHFPESHAFQALITYQDPLTEGGSMPNKGDFTGYVPINGSSTNGYLGINSENYDGGVTMLDIDFNSITKLWNVSRSEIVDFSPVAGTSRNCSGGISPWGTFLTCEEIIDTNDSNGDGYGDYGWIVEVDPATKQVIGKHFAMGQVSHENVVVHSNQRTAYFGSDSNPGYIFKYVANTPTDLSSGDLFVYSGSKSGSGQWLQVPNTTIAERNSTNAYCYSIGATSFAGVEDLEIGPDGKVYAAVKGENTVYRFQDSDPITGMSVTDFEAFAGNMAYTINHENGVSDYYLGYGHDNLAFDDLGNLYVLQDGENMHIWMIRPGHTQANPQIEIFARAPNGAETTGMTFSPDYKFMFLTIQHPSTNNGSTLQEDAAGNMIPFNKDVTMVIARKEYLGICEDCVTCDDGIQNGNETGADCGGPDCAPCLTVNLNKTDVSCYEGSDGTVSVNATGGIGNVNYQWNTNATGQSINNLSAGNYAVTATDALGNSAVSSITVSQPNSALVANGNAIDVTTSGGSNGSIELSLTGGVPPYTCNWSNGATSENIYNLSAGNYSVVVNDNNNCTQTKYFVVDEVDCSNIAVSLTANQISCNGEADGNITSSVTGGIPPINYQWSNSNTNSPYLVGIAEGSYQLNITDGAGCTATNSVTLTEPAELLLTITKDNVSSFGGNDGAAYVVANGGTAPFSYAWSNGSNAANITNLVAGIYTIEVTDANGCSQTGSVVISNVNCNNLTVELSSNDVSCNNGNDGQLFSSVSGGNPPYNYMWNNGNQTANINNLASNLYSLTVTDNLGCTTVIDYQVEEPAVLSTSVDVVNESMAGANDGQASVNVIGGYPPYQYMWSTGETESSISALTPGNYNITITDANGCEKYLAFNISIGEDVCEQPINVNVADVLDAGAVITWSSNANAQDYTIRYRRLIGSGSWSSFTTNVNTLILSELENCMPYEVIVSANCSSNSSYFSVPVSFETTGCEAPCNAIQGLFTSNVTSQSALIAWDIYPGATYHLSYRKGGGAWFKHVTQVPIAILFGLENCENYEWFVEVECSTTEMSPSSEMTNFNTSGCGQKLAEIDDSYHSVNLYPNPNNGTFYIEMDISDQSEYYYTINDINGRILYQDSFISEIGINKLSIDNLNLPKGLHFINVTGAKYNSQKQFTVH